LDVLVLNSFVEEVAELGMSHLEIEIEEKPSMATYKRHDHEAAK
jgi:hypothetical protein